MAMKKYLAQDSFWHDYGWRLSFPRGSLLMLP